MTREQLVRYRGRTVVGATPDRVFLALDLQERPSGNPELKLILFMASYARDVLSGELPGPYDEEQALRYARTALIPGELLERAIDDLPAMAAWLGGLPAVLTGMGDAGLEPATSALSRRRSPS